MCERQTQHARRKTTLAATQTPTTMASAFARAADGFPSSDRTHEGDSDGEEDGAAELGARLVPDAVKPEGAGTCIDDGAGVGAALGVDDGAGDGAALGARVGDPVVGLGVGADVGACDGAGVGVGVGISVGAGVGVNVSTDTESAVALDMSARRRRMRSSRVAPLLPSRSSEITRRRRRAANVWIAVVNAPVETASSRIADTCECTELPVPRPYVLAMMRSGIVTSLTTVTPSEPSV